jgi:hypothetical protein
MRQEINLHQQVSSGTRAPFAASTVTFAAAVFTLALLASWGYGRWEVSRLALAVERVHAEQKAQLTMLSTAGAARAPQSVAVDVEARIRTLGVELSARMQALDLIRAGAIGQRTGFAGRLEALSRRNVEGIWLDRLALAGGDNMMNLSGATLDAGLVPRYLQSLAADPVLKGTRFDELVIEQPAKGDSHATASRPLRFHAGSQTPASPKSPEPS